jgi:CBS domain containing-hemolysin-like protein
MKRYTWIYKTIVITFMLAIFTSLISDSVISRTNLILAFLILFFIVLIGIVFDTIGIAVAASAEKPYHAMAAKGNFRARYAVQLIKNASQVSNFCNDVIGDICGIISGAAGATITLRIIALFPGQDLFWISVIFSAVLAAVTVGGKAFGKELALSHHKEIVMQVAHVLQVLDERFHIHIVKGIKKGKRA